MFTCIDCSESTPLNRRMPSDRCPECYVCVVFAAVRLDPEVESFSTPWMPWMPL